MGDEAALGVGESDFGNVATNLALLDLVFGRQPVPDRNVERHAGRIAEVPDAIRAVDRKLGGIDAVCVVEAKGRQVGAARAVESSFVRTIPVSPTASLNARAWARPF